MKRIAALFVLTMPTLVSERLPANAENVLFIIDFSGSMKRAVDGRPMIAIAKDVFRITLFGEMK